MTTQNIFVFTMCLFGLMSALRSLHQLNESAICERDDVKTAAALHCFFLSAPILISIWTPIFAIGLMALHILGTTHILKIALYFKFRKFENQKIFFLSFLILKMKGGLSLRSAIKELTLDFESGQKFLYVFARQLRETLETAKVSRGLSELPNTAELAREILQAEQSPQHCLKRLINLRERFKKQFSFRQRSGQALTQIRAQTIILGFLYGALMAFVTYQYGIKRFVELRVLSIVLFGIGVTSVFYLGGKIKWKV